MRALVVYESMFGNTETIARAVGAGVAARMPVYVVEVGHAPTTIDPDVTLLVVGGPTHAFGMSRPQTRQDAAKQAEGHVVSEHGGIREWLGEVSGSAPVAATTFDTRMKQGWIPGSAARSAQKRLRGKGFVLNSAPQSFYVEGTPGPLLEGEPARARQWGEQLAARYAPTSR